MAVSFYDTAAVDALIRELRIDPYLLRRARNAFFKKAAPPEAALAELPAENRTAFAAAVQFGTLTDLRRFDSGLDEATKLVFRTTAGFAIESVILRPATGRTTLCVSSQVGCAAACSFCATGHMGVARDLTADEILDQVVNANAILKDEGRRVRNLVFMGMGEPMHNEQEVQTALSVLQDPACFDHPASRILVSTVGVPAPLLRTVERFPTTNFALSLHSASQATREQIIPLARRYSLDQLRDAVLHLNQVQPETTKVMIEYLMLDEVNDSPEAAQLLLSWISGLRVHVNLIPFNSIPHRPELKCSPRSRIDTFGETIRSAGFPTTIRYSLGSDIEAACGQLVQSENRSVAKSLAQATASTSN
ncbi:Ribosomal RNA large subunit methyltransferase Cfr [Botrimarina colliarenosi]|uniref:Ribosomal RNA large subunit methyltransferase Cfr n=1 Tax=Botrimarina colliarenosi TaxID=2528001 RepID=A0A5C6ABG9_9BACT|nr:23S rRNA (adenine(2503)-C(2))-methyltransferase RlmN [Botrimarina colliarenosi]TWT96776.1 Ribosomal RNA large subunit methyltransferase Cfr [Botrimarina colliarenosi]